MGFGEDIARFFREFFDPPDPANNPKPTPQVKPFVKPWMYSPQVAKDQQTTYNPMSTSQNYLARFGVAKHF